jgi:hypothetical protein
MTHDMHSSSLVQDVGTAVPEPPFIKYRATPSLHARNMQAVLTCVKEFTAAVGLHPTVSMTDLDDYFRWMSRNQAFGILGTTPGNGTIWLFLLARKLNPKIIVESGVYRGSSLFTLRHAAPHAKMFAFDLNFSLLLSKLDGVDYRQHMLF